MGRKTRTSYSSVRSHNIEDFTTFTQKIQNDYTYVFCVVRTNTDIQRPKCPTSDSVPDTNPPIGTNHFRLALGTPTPSSELTQRPIFQDFSFQFWTYGNIDGGHITSERNAITLSDFAEHKKFNNQITLVVTPAFRPKYQISIGSDPNKSQHHTASNNYIGKTVLRGRK